MAKEKGSPKTGGRQKGVVNKEMQPIRDAFKSLIEANLEQLQNDIEALEPRDRIKAITELSKFCVPTLKAVELNDITPKEKEPKKIVFVRRD